MKKFIAFTSACSLFVLSLSCDQKEASVKTTQFDSCIYLGHEAIRVAEEWREKYIKVSAELEAWKYSALKCNPLIRVSQAQ